MPPFMVDACAVDWGSASNSSVRFLNFPFNLFAIEILIIAYLRSVSRVGRIITRHPDLKHRLKIMKHGIWNKSEAEFGF